MLGRFPLAFAAVSAALFLVLPSCGPRLEPLVSADGAPAPRRSLPADAVVVHCSAAARIDAPFVLHDDATSVTGRVLLLPEGAASRGHSGSAQGNFTVSEAGDYHVWLRARWRDSCGNSLDLTIDDQQPRVVQDGIFSAWHWVEAGTCPLGAGEHKLTLGEREDGIAADQILFTRDADFLPTGAVTAEGVKTGVRCFADDFTRSPGHGMETWNLISGKWEIVFSFDPNRIPNQYALVGSAVDGRALAAVKGPSWRGCRLAFSVRPAEGGNFGAVLERRADGERELSVAFALNGAGASLAVNTTEGELTAPLAGRLRPDQWHRVEVERWAWLLRVRLDGVLVLDSWRQVPAAGGVGLFIRKGKVVFDDVVVEEIPWEADDGRDFRMPWIAGKDARWFRPAEPDAARALIGRRGDIRLGAGALPIREFVLEDDPTRKTTCLVVAPDLEDVGSAAGRRVFRAPADDRAGGSVVTLRAPPKGGAVRRAAIRYGRPTPDVYVVGPFHFTRSHIDDPSDYLDFTEEEYRAMARSPEAQKLLRRPRRMPMLGSDKSPWAPIGGIWQVTGGLLRARGPGAVLRHSQAINSDMEFRLRFRRLSPDTTMDIELYGGPEPGTRILIDTGDPANETDLHLACPYDDEWHDLRIRTEGDLVTAALDGKPPLRRRLPRADGGWCYLRVGRGAAEFDDIEFMIDRRGRGARFFAFDRRETEWWREGAWMDHGGISCALASRWISLIAPADRGMLWSKYVCGPDVQVAFNVEENSKWYGWRRNPSHEHFPYDNICAVLADGTDFDRGYRLEINADGRSKTVLYRNNTRVAELVQDGDFPMQYVGGHAPYRPRRNRINLVKRGGLLRAFVNGVEILRYTDPAPLPVSRVAIGGYRTRINFSHLEVRELARAK